MAKETVIGKFVNKISFALDKSTVQDVKTVVKDVKKGIETIQDTSEDVKKKVQNDIDDIKRTAKKAREETAKIPTTSTAPSAPTTSKSPLKTPKAQPIKLPVDPSEGVKTAKDAIDEIRGYAQKVLGAIGIGFSLTQVNALAEEFGKVNDAIRGATREMGDQEEIQQKILQGAKDCREEYGVMAGKVTALIQQNKELFPVDDAVKFVSIVEKLEKGSGQEGNVDSTLDALTKAVSSGSMDSSAFDSLKESAPEVVEALSSALGVSDKQLRQMAVNGTLTAKVLKDAFFSAESEIQKNFDELGYSISDSIVQVRNEWGLWIADLDKTFGITTRIGKVIRDVSGFVLEKAQRVTTGLKNISDKLGGAEQLLKLIAMAAAALFLATNGSKILSLLGSAVKLLQGFNLQTAIAAAKWLLLFLVLEDVWTFFQGGDSVIGRFLQDAGVDVDALRENVFGFFEKAKAMGASAISSLAGFWEEHKDTIIGVLNALWTGCADLVHDILLLCQHLADLISGVIIGFQTGDWTQFLTGCRELWEDFLAILDAVGEAVFGELWDPMKDAAQEIWDWLTGFFSWIGEKIQWAKNLWSGVKGFFTGDDSEDDDETEDDPKTSKDKKTSQNKLSTKNTSTKSTSSQSKTTKDPVTGALVSGGGAVSNNTVMTAPLSQNTTNKNISVRQENNQSYTFQVNERTAADRLGTVVRSQDTQSTDQLARALSYGR